MLSLILLSLGPALLFGADSADRAVRVLEQRCLSCHNAATRMAGVQLTSSAEVLSHKAKLVAAIGYAGKIKMPPTGALPADEAAALRTWLDAGAPFAAKPGTSTVAAPALWSNRGRVWGTWGPVALAVTERGAWDTVSPPGRQKTRGGEGSNVVQAHHNIGHPPRGSF